MQDENQDFLRMENVCRTCLRTTDNLSPLYSNKTLILKIETISSIQIDTSDAFPTVICAECTENVERLYNFRLVIINNDKDLKERIATINSEQTEDENDKPLGVGTASLLYAVVPPQQDEVLDESLQNAFNKLRYCKCKICGRSFSSRFKLYNHRRTEHIAPGVCNICGVVVRSDNLKRHVQMHSASPAQCLHCGKVFKNSESLRGHLQIHKGMVFTCEICGKQSKVKAEYKRHMKTHLNPEIRKSVCTICGKKVRDLKRHIQSHTGEKPYSCVYCNRGFTSTYSLKVHIRQHTNERPYVCEFCPMSFPQKVSLNTHLKSKHNNKS